MRILFLYLFPLWGNGSGSFLRELSLKLIEMGHDVAIVAPDKRKVDGVKLYQVSPSQMGVFVGHPELPNAKSWAEMSGKELGDIYTTYLRTTLEAVSDFKPDLIHVFHTAFLPEIGRVVKALFGIRYMITTHGSDLSFLLTKDRRFMPLIQDANKHARYITAVSDFTKDWYLQIFGQDLKRKVMVTVGGVNINRFKKDQSLVDEIDKKYNIKGKKVVLFTGRLTRNKGVHFLIKAAFSINAVVLIVGDGPEKENLEKEIREKGLPNVIMAGYVNNANPLFHAFYERADVYVSPSVWNEPLGLTILEAMAAKTPVVATRKGGVLSIIKDGANGFLIKARNSTEIAQMVNVLLDDDALRKRLSEAAYKTVLEKFSWDKVALRFETLYKEMKSKEKIKDAGPLDELVNRIFPRK